MIISFNFKFKQILWNKAVFTPSIITWYVVLKIYPAYFRCKINELKLIKIQPLRIDSHCMFIQLNVLLTNVSTTTFVNNFWTQQQLNKVLQQTILIRIPDLYRLKIIFCIFVYNIFNILFLTFLLHTYIFPDTCKAYARDNVANVRCTFFINIFCKYSWKSKSTIKFKWAYCKTIMFLLKIASFLQHALLES